MNNSASRFKIQHQVLSAESRNFMYQLADHTIDPGAIKSVLKLPVEAQPLLTLQRLALQEIPVICVCDDFRAAQRYFCEAVKSEAIGRMQPFIIHEMMPAHHQDYVLENLGATRDFNLPCNAVLVTTRQFLPQVIKRLHWLTNSAEIISTSQSGKFHQPVTASLNPEPTVSCICLRSSAAGKWVLMDHDDAATVHASQTPSPELAARLLRHTINISGNRLAPYLAMMFDVPYAWKHHPELATRSLLVFNPEVCDLGCFQAGIPQKIIWNDLLGIIYDA